MYIKHKLKNGIELDFDDQNHIYYCNGEKVESVTGICGKGIPKPQLVNWLVYTPIREIKDSINHFMDNGKTLDRVSLERIVHQATNKTDRVKDDAGLVGSVVHGLIEDFLQGYTKSTGKIERYKDLLTLGVKRKYNDYLKNNKN